METTKWEVGTSKFDDMVTYEERIRVARNELSPSFSLLADFLLDSYTQAAFLNATELAHSLDIDPATVVRFAQRLGYPGYPELQREIRRKVKDDLLNERPADSNTTQGVIDSALTEVANNLELTRRSFPTETAESLVAALDKAERVIILAEGLAFAPARSLASLLETAGYTVHLSGSGPSDLARALAGARKGDLAIAVEVVNESSLIAKALAAAREAGVRTVAFVAAPSSPSADHADLVIAGFANPTPGVGQVIVEAMIHAITRVLTFARPGRFQRIPKKVEELTHRLEHDHA